MRHLTTEELEAGLPHVGEAPADAGTVEMIVRRPAVDERELLEEAELRLDVGLAGDTWPDRPSRHTDDGGPDPGRQVAVMSARAVDLVAGQRDRWPLAGDQLYVDLDIGEDNLPAGTRLAVGTAVLEVTAQPHRGCVKFRARFGADAMRFVNSPAGLELRLRGVNTTVVEPGIVRRGDAVKKL